MTNEPQMGVVRVTWRLFNFFGAPVLSLARVNLSISNLVTISLCVMKNPDGDVFRSRDPLREQGNRRHHDFVPVLSPGESLCIVSTTPWNAANLLKFDIHHHHHHHLRLLLKFHPWNTRNLVFKLSWNFLVNGATTEMCGCWEVRIMIIMYFLW